MPEFLEKKLRAEYGNNPSAIYGTMNKLGAMKGNKETAKGREMEKKHMEKMTQEKSNPGRMKEMHVQFHRDNIGKLSGMTVKHIMEPKRTGAAFMQDNSQTHAFGPEQSEQAADHVQQHMEAQTEA